MTGIELIEKLMLVVSYNYQIDERNECYISIYHVLSLLVKNIYSGIQEESWLLKEKKFTSIFIEKDARYK